MAEGGGDKQNPFLWNQCDEDDEPIDDTDNGRFLIANQTRVLMNHFIYSRLQREGCEVREEELFVPDTPRDPRQVGLRRNQEIANAIMQIGDELDGDPQIQGMLESVPLDAPRETFMNVARSMFQDGNFNWGRVVVLFYFAAKMAMKALQEKVLDKMPVVRTVIEWVVKFIKDYVASWIISRGGWKAIKEYFGSSTGQVTAVFALGVISAIFAYRKYKP